MNEHATTLRQLKLLVVVLVLSNIGLGVWSFYLLRRIDRRYSELIERSVPVLNDLQSLTVKALAAMLATNPTGLAVVGDRRLAIAEDVGLRRKLIASDLLALGERERTELQAAGDEFSRLAQEVLAQVSGGRSAEGLRMRNDVLRPAFDRYIAATTRAVDGLEASSLQANRAMSDSTSSTSAIMLGLASWPVILLFGILLLTAVFVLVLMVLFRGREMSDTP